MTENSLTAREWSGFVKVKMLHREGATILLPEVVLIEEADLWWVQPQFVYAPLLMFTEEDAEAVVRCAALDRRREVAGLDLEIRLSAEDRQALLPDRSEVYRCRVSSDHPAEKLAVGTGRVVEGGGLDLRLYHHTLPETVPLIANSGVIWGSPWNYQGNRQLSNVGYAYFTSLAAIGSEEDLRSIAMASDGQIGFRVDSNPSSNPDLVLDVYRESTRNRAGTIEVWVPSELISTPHIWMHAGPPVNYEVTHPWIYRVGLMPDAQLALDGNGAKPEPGALKRFDYAVVGDCTTIAGLEAPFDEENTAETFVVEDLTDTDLFEFWRTHQNTALHEHPVETQEFES